MYILVVSYGCPSRRFPQNGVFQMDQAQALAELGHKVVFAAIDVRSIRRWRHWGLVEREYRSLPVIEFNFPMGSILPNLRFHLSQIGFRWLLRKVTKKYGKPDVVHVHFGETARIIATQCMQNNIPYVVTEHSSDINKDDLTETEVAPFRYVYQNASAVIAVSGALAKRIQRYTGIKATVIPNIIDLSIFHCKRLPHKGYRFISAGHLNIGKGFDVLIKAFCQAKDRGLIATLLIMGEGPEREHLNVMVKELGLQEHVTFYGAYVRAQFAEELSKSDSFVLPSRGETFGVVYAEAMASGLPVIATYCGGPEDFVYERNGILVNIDDPQELADAMLQMQKNKYFDAYEISNFAIKNFSARTVAEKVEQVLIEGTKKR